MKVAINGFGRIGRQILRIIQQKQTDLEVVLINDLTDGETLAHLFEFDSTYGRADCGDTCYKDGMLSTKHGPIHVTASKDPATLPYKELGVDLVLECTGVFRKRDDAALHLKAGAKKVIISAPAKDEVDGTFCYGINHTEYKSDMEIISNASCTTNCLAPMAKVLHENFGIKSGLMNTIHSYTNDQSLLDLPHKDLRRARAAAINLVPTSTGAAKAIGLVIPELKGKLDGIAVRVPTPTGSIVDLAVETEKKVTREAVNDAFKKAANGELKGILHYETRPLVLQDFVGDPNSCTLDSALTQVGGENLVKVFGWYDNEWGYSERMVDLAQYISKN
jgi:glyceraldehyde-3-phosphate dehydrogenase type I